MSLSKSQRKRREFPDMILYKAVQAEDDELGEAVDFNEAMKAVEERHSKELQRAREMHAATEKLHRTRCVDSKTQRTEKQAECEELEYQARRRRFLAEIRREKERLAEEEARMNLELEETKQNASRENAKVIERLKQDYQETVEECVEKHQNEIKSLKALELEKQAWMNSYKKDQATRISHLESKIRNQCKRERDKDIELIIENLKLKQHQTRSGEWNLDYGGVL
jgi:5-azacytidine-induced protein 1